jgi:flagellar biosynthesis protein FlhG
MTRRSASASHPAAAPAAGRVFAVASGKGGVGKTWFSISLAHALGRAAGRRVLLFDGDLGLANVDIQLGLDAARDLGDVLAGRARLAEAATPFADGGFDVLAGRSGSGSLATLTPDRVAALRDQLMTLAGSYDAVLVDLSAGVDRPVRALAAAAGTCLVVTTPEPTALTDAYAFIKVTRSARPEADLRIVINMAETAEEGRQTYATLAKACEKFLGHRPPLAGIVRRDGHVPETIRAQAPLLRRHPDCDAAHDVATIAEGLMVTA